MDDKNEGGAVPHTTKGTAGSTLGGAVAGAVAGSAVGVPVAGAVIGAVSGAVIGAAKKRAAGTRQKTKSTCYREEVVKQEIFSDKKGGHSNETKNEVGIGCYEETVVKEKDLNEQHSSQKDRGQEAYAQRGRHFG